MKKIVVLSGAGISADSGIATFRSSDGLWANHKIEDVCSPRALEINREKVIEFYNMRRKELFEKQPNAGHFALKNLEKKYEVQIITQNVDNMHERAQSSKILHLHGELMKLSSYDKTQIFELNKWEQKLDDKTPDGSLLRPYIVFFGEQVPMMNVAAEYVMDADVCIVVGTSLAVYPAASLVSYLPEKAEIFLIDPKDVVIYGISNKIRHIKKGAAEGLPELVEELLAR